jgi:hypothetical protein
MGRFMLDSSEFLDFACVAAPRSGTTWLFEALRQHRSIHVPAAKELNFFNEAFLGHMEFKYSRGIAYYRRQFDGASSDALLGDVSPTYYVDPRAAQRIHQHFPNARIVCLLRNPVEVVYSTYLKTRAYHPVPSTFRSAIEEHPEFLELGYYFKHLIRYCELFPMEHIYLQTYEAFFGSAAAECAALYRFLGVDDKVRPTVLGERVNARKEVRWPAVVRLRHTLQMALNHRAALPLKRWLTRSNLLMAVDKRMAESNLRQSSLPALEEDARRRLADLYRNDTDQLQRLFGLDLDVWRQ